MSFLASIVQDLPDNYVKSVVAGQVRSIMIWLAGIIVGLHWISAADSASFVRIGSGIAVGLVMMAWSAWQKTGHSIKVSVVKNGPAKEAVT